MTEDKHNLYEAPSANLSEGLSTGRDQARPREVRTAVYLLWIVWVLGFPYAAILVMRDPAEYANLFFMAFMAVAMALHALVNYGVWCGWSWCRIVTAVLGFISFFSVLVTSWEGGYVLLEYLIDIVSTILTLVALLLLWRKPASAWFQRDTG